MTPTATNPQGKRNLVLTGFMGTGKTSVGRLLAEELGLRFVDTDALVEERAGMSIRRIWETGGEEAFRRLERSVIQEVAAGADQVIASGGGAVLDAENRQHLFQSSWVVCLTASPEEILRRVRKSQNRPLLQERNPAERIRSLLAQREPVYAMADLVVETTGRSPKEVAAEVARWWDDRTRELLSRRVWVELGERSYWIHLGEGLLADTGEILRRVHGGSDALLITDTHVGPLYASRVCESLDGFGYRTAVHTVAAGEEAKSLGVLQEIYDAAVAHHLNRDGVIVALGGGVVGDLAGFAAATYLRGVAFLQVPTSLMAQVDSSIGGKTGVNHPRGKNLIGAFHQPCAVVTDVATLATLPPEEFRNGLAEVIKYGCIAEASFLDWLEAHRDEVLQRQPTALVYLVMRSCRIKGRVVRADERESGLREILNFGHTIGHALEAVGGYRGLRHGEGVAIGMMAAARLSEEVGLAPAGTSQRVAGLLRCFDLPVAAPGYDPAALLEKIALDKKVRSGRVRFVLLEEIGRARPGVEVPSGVLTGILHELTQAKG